MTAVGPGTRIGPYAVLAPIGAGGMGEVCRARLEPWPASIFRLDIKTRRRELWKELRPADAAGVEGIGQVTIRPDGTAYAYDCHRRLSDLYLVEGLR